MSALKELLVEELADIYFAEKQLLKALPKMAKAAEAGPLKKAFEKHLEQTEKQVERLEKVFQALEVPVKSKKCDAMLGLLEEGKSIMEEWKGSPALDAALISAAQKVEHYEIATYGCLCTWAKLLGNQAALKLLKETLNEEETTDKSLSTLAERNINKKAYEQEMESEAKPSNAKPTRSQSRRK